MVHSPLLLFVERLVQLPVATGPDSPESNDPLCGYYIPPSTGYLEPVSTQVPARSFNDAGSIQRCNMTFIDARQLDPLEMVAHSVTTRSVNLLFRDHCESRMRAKLAKRPVDVA